MYAVPLMSYRESSRRGTNPTILKTYRREVVDSQLNSIALNMVHQAIGSKNLSYIVHSMESLMYKSVTKINFTWGESLVHNF
jgi:hypothetical protein